MFFYDQLIEEMKEQIIQNFGSVSDFCRKNNISRPNLCAVFSGKQDISVGLYLRIATSLGVVSPLPTLPECGVSLRDYLSINHDLVIHSMISIHMKG